MDAITDNFLGGLDMMMSMVVIFLAVFFGWLMAMFCTWLFAPPRANPFKRGQLKNRMIEALAFTTGPPLIGFGFGYVGGSIFEFLCLVGLFFGFVIGVGAMALVINDLDFSQAILFAMAYVFMWFGMFWVCGWLCGAAPPEEEDTVAIMQWIMDNGRYLASYLR